MTILSLFLVFCFAGTALAKDNFPDAQALYDDWETNGYPDDVGNVYFDDVTSNLVITLVKPTEARKKEILAMIKNSANLSFGESQYAYNDMLTAQKKIEAEMLSGDKNIFSVGVGWRVTGDTVTGFGPSGKEARVVVTVDQSVLDKYAKAYQARYGDMVYVESGNAPILLDSANKQKANTWIWPACIAMFLVACTAFWISRRRLVLVMQTAHGATVTERQRLNTKLVVQAVRESALTPPDSIYDKLKEKL